MDRDLDPEILAAARDEVSRLRESVQATGSAAAQLQSAGSILSSASVQLTNLADSIGAARTTLEVLRDEIAGLDAAALLRELRGTQAAVAEIRGRLDAVGATLSDVQTESIARSDHLAHGVARLGRALETLEAGAGELRNQLVARMDAQDEEARRAGSSHKAALEALEGRVKAMVTEAEFRIGQGLTRLRALVGWVLVFAVLSTVLAAVVLALRLVRT